MAIGGTSKTRNLFANKCLQKRQSVRRVLLETLESRQLLAVGPQLVGIQPNSGDLLENGEVLNVSPRELVFRFNDGVGIDPATLSGIRVIRSGEDGVFDRAAVATDLGTGGQTLVEFYAETAGQAGNGIELRFTTASRTDSRLPVLRVTGRRIDIELNSNPALETRVSDLLQVFQRNSGTPATNLVFALPLRGSQTIAVGRTVDTSRSLVLSGANSAKASTNFGLSNNLEVRFIARDSGSNGLGISVNVTARDRGGAGQPIVTVSGSTVNVELNSNPRFATTTREFVDAINASPTASLLIEAQLVSGSAATRIGGAPTTYSPIVLTGVSDIEIIPGYVGMGDSNREVVVRFAETLPDDSYRVEILGQGSRSLRNLDGEAFNMGVSASIAFELDLGVEILSVVPQPVTRDPLTGALSWDRTDEIDIYLTNDKLIDVRNITAVNGLTLAQLRAERGGVLFLQNSDVISFAGGSTQRGVLNPQFYQLISSNGTLDPADDDPAVTPSRVRYYPEADRVSLRFPRNLDEYAVAGGELRLRVGTNEARPLAPVQVDATGFDPADTFAGALDLSSGLTPWTPGTGSQSVLINSAIRNETPFVLDFPGGSDEPGNRQIRMQDNLRLGADSTDGTSEIFYNFQGNLGGGFLNAITEQQKQRVREVMSLYEQYLGVRFIESSSKGLTIAVGDMSAVSPFPDIVGSTVPGRVEPNQPGLTAFEAGTLAAGPSAGQLATVLDSQDFSSSTVNTFGGTFTRAAMQAVGQLLGLGDADELEQLTVQSFSSVFAPGVGTEIILPGDGDLVHGQFLYRPDSKDIDLYQFRLPAGPSGLPSGKLKIEAFAERMSEASLLDTQIRLFQETPNGWQEIAANDDYFSSDSYLELELAPGNYIVGVSASGNADYDPELADSGLGGRSQGSYQLRMDFTPPAPSVLRDADNATGGTAFDGDGDGVPGGTFDFWFRPSNTATTKFVDKSAPAGGTGTIAAPFRTIGAAITAATATGGVVRVLGNGGTDRDLTTIGDNRAYEIGFDSQGRPLADGTTLDVPKNVSLMIDAGAILKLRRARVGVGSTSVSVDRSGGSLLVLGTPTLQTADGRILRNADGEPVVGSVYMTSLNDSSVGAASTVASGAAAPGDWGGIDFQRRVDTSNGRENLEKEGIFLNWVSNADLRFGGGQVVVDGVSQTIAPIQITDARPTVLSNRISSSADAAMSATPDSFAETNFHSPMEMGGAAPFTVDYQRVGPSIQGNRLTNNSINGLQVRVRTSSANQLEKLTVQARFDDTEIVHFIPENLEVQGTSGGALELANGTLVSRLDARLVIDAGTVVKSQGSRIDVSFGGQLIAEGGDGVPVVFTSINDTRYGAGGTFDTANRNAVAGSGPVSGDWGGIYVGHTSKASFADAVLSYGGGTTRIEGGFADFSAIEVHQSDVRIADSRLEFNADGDGPSSVANRAGRGTNSPAAIFVRGAQPIIVDNIIRDNLAPAISTNVSSLNSTFVDDSGRSRGHLDRVDSSGNQGLLIDGNRLAGNSINGLVVRGVRPTPTTQDPNQLSGDFLTTEGVWDDTDIVHVVLDQIVVPDFHAFGGLTLKSSGSESLVVKLQSNNTATGDVAGITASGRRLDNADRIGGSVRILGTAGHPVIMTALTDSTVGAGFTPGGDPQQATVSATQTPAGGAWRSVRLEPTSNDRNVARVSENESADSTTPNFNGTPATSQFLGGLAPNQLAGDENRRLGFEIHGAISAGTDADVYSFEAQAGTQVWLDIDRTRNSLDTILELVDANGNTLALSDNSFDEEADPSLLQVNGLPRESVNPLRLSTPELYFESAAGQPKDLYSTNPRDAGFRVSLPGASGTTNLYHVRVSSANGTHGEYQLQVRLSEIDEVPGSSITYADIRFAQTGLELIGLPSNSPLLGENSEVENRPGGNDTFSTNAQALGNLLETNRQAISVAGNIDDTTDVDWFSFDIDYQRIRPTSIREYFATVLDVDYADGLGRPDVSLFVFDSRGYLIISGLGSDLVDDQASPLSGAGSSDLSRGSSGTLDPYVDSFELPAGRYYLAVTNSSRMPEDLTQFTLATSANPLVRLQPIESVQLIAEDHVGSNGGSTAASPLVSDLFVGNSAAVPWTLGDVVLYVSRDAGAATNLYAVNPFTGETAINFDNLQNVDVEDIAFRPNGELRAFDRAILGVQPADLDTGINYVNINSGTGQFTVGGTTGLETFHLEAPGAPPVPAAVASNDGIHPEAITFASIGNQERGFFVGNRPSPAGYEPVYDRDNPIPRPNPLPNVGATRPGPEFFSNVLYEFDEATGAALGAVRTGVLPGTSGAGTAIVERGYIETRAPAGTLPTSLIAREATATSAGALRRVLVDGDTFTVVDRTGPPINRVFEFDFGPEVTVAYDAVNRGVRDGMRFVLDGTTYEFDTGSVVVIGATNGSELADGSTVTIRSSGGVEKVFEFDNDGTLTAPANVAVRFSAGSTQAELAEGLVAAVNSDLAFGVRASTVAGGRVSFLGATSVTPIAVTGTGLTVEGGVGVAVGAVRIPISEAASESQFISAIQAAMPASIVASFEAGRLNFSGASTASFTDLANAGIVNVVRTTSGVVTGRIAVNLQANDSAATVAKRIAAAVNGLGIVGLSAALDVTDPARVNFFGSSLGPTGPLTTAGVAPGGIVTGIGVVDGVLFAVSDEGGLYRMTSPEGVNRRATYVSSSYDLLGIPFTGLAVGPSSNVTGAIGQILFGIDANGVVHAFDTNGRLQPVFANGATSVSTGLSGANGLAFSTLQSNLWSTTSTADNTNREANPGHGLLATPNDSRGASQGGTSYYFGDNTAVNYNFPGGAAGALESTSFSLAGISQADLPMLYFNYFIDTEHTNNANNNPVTNATNMRDAFRVYASGEDGQWILLATNNTDTRFELAIDDDVQPLFNRNDNWRQARVPLDRLAGQENIRLRIEFSTGGGFGYGLQGGAGPEIRTKAGDRLSDGETFVIQGVTFEIEKGPTLTLPGRSSIANGQSVTIDGIRYVFTDGTGPAIIAPDVPVLLAPEDQTAEQVAAALKLAIDSSTAIVPEVTGLSFTEGNDILDQANRTGITGENIRVTGLGSIGDRPANPDRDVDMVRLELLPGSTLNVDANTTAIGSLLSSFLRLFDSEGTEVARSGVSGGDSSLTFTSLRGGTFFIGVSGAGNQAYDAVIPGFTSVGSTGDYRLEIEVTQPVSVIADGNRLQLQDARNVTVAPGTPILVQGASGTRGVPVRVTSDMSAAEVAEVVRQAIADQFSNGRAASFPVRSGDTISLFELDVTDAGPFGFTTQFPGANRTTFNSPLRAQNNNNEGVYLDDFIIGIAGRGEMVLQPRAAGTGIAGDTDFVAVPDAPNEIRTGPYQFEIRGGEEYGLPTTTGINLTDTFPISGRSSPGLSIRFSPASELVAGATFTVGDGPRLLTFELDDVNDLVGVGPGNIALQFNTAVVNSDGSTTSESAEIIAARFRDLLNSPAIQAQLDVAANLINNDQTGATSDTVVLIGNAIVDIAAPIGEKLVSTSGGGANRERPQGQVIINSVRVSDSSAFGVSITAAPRDTVTGAPLTGSARNTITLNTEELTVGAVVLNSEFLFNGSGGINIVGDSQLTSGTVPDATRAFVRLVNNTIVGGSVASGTNALTPGGTGISVTSNATATLLNNVILNSATAINVDASSNSTVIGGTVFQGNTTNTAGAAGLGQFPTVVPAGAQIYRDVASRNLYPASSSPVIDSSIDSLEDRLSLVAVKEPLGLAASPILAPLLDINGQLRVDDPSVETPSGLGESVFKDRGAQDRADFSGPSLILLNPLDNDFGGIDGNPSEGIVEISGRTLSNFDIQIVDGLEPSDPSRGSGVDDSSVTSSSVLVFGPKVVDGVRVQNQPLVEGRDYRFGYDSTNGVVRLTPLAGIWEPESVYTIRFLNEAAAAFVAQATYVDGQQISIVDASDTQTTFEVDLGYVITVPPIPADPTTVDGRTFALDDGTRRVVFEIDVDGVVTSGNQAIDVSSATTSEGLGRLIENAINNAGLNLTVTEIGPGLLQIQGSRMVMFDPIDSGLTSTGRPGVQTAFGLQIPLQAGQPNGLTDGQTFAINRTGTPVRFELDSDGSVAEGNIAVTFTSTSTADQVAASLIAAINTAAIGLTPANAGGGLVTLGGDATTTLDLSQTVLTQSGLAGQPAAIAIPASAAANQTADSLATLIKQAIDSRNLPGVTTIQFGDRIFIEGIQSASGVGAEAIGPIRDQAGNTLKPNQANGTTTVTIFLGEGLDYGDAPAPYASTNAQNGPRHTVVDGFSLGPTVTSDADAKLDDLDEDDGVSFSGLFASFASSVTLTVSNPDGRAAFASVWIDFDGNGVFSDAERVVFSELVTTPTATFTFNVPSTTSNGSLPRTTLGETFARVRLSSSASAISTPIGTAPDGEVEDHQVTLRSNPFTNANGITDSAGNALDVNNDQFVSAIDVLQIINWINDPTRPNTLSLAGATGLPPFVDANGDGLVSASDVNIVVTFLNSRPPAGGGEGEGVDSFVNGRLSKVAGAGESIATRPIAGIAELGSQEVVLASNWAAGLENMIRGRANASNYDTSAAKALATRDQALLQADEDHADLANSVAAEINIDQAVDSFWAQLSEIPGSGRDASSDDSLDDSLPSDLLHDWTLQ